MALVAATARPLTIADHGVIATVEPELGGRLARLAFDGTDLLLARDAVPEAADPIGWGAYPMVPWAGRVRNGRFTFRGVHHELPINMGAHAIHGVGFTSDWDVVDADGRSVELALALPADQRWPFGGTAGQRIALDGRGVLLELWVTATDRAFPTSIGWHPWFRTPSRVEFHPNAMYRRDGDGITLDELVEVRHGPWDDCFVNDRPVRLTVDGCTVELTSDCTDWVVFDERPYATCVEPQSAPPDALNIRPHVVEPGSSLQRWYRIDRAA